MVIQVMIRLVLYIDQAIIRGHIVGYSATNTNTSRQGIDNTVSTKIWSEKRGR
ncbi:hypothetical protein E2C01_073595 [Portunus trituberculatus]|uniref:Uncharacterized protein n=1 Tax=Portunus trituberculatus TaxID=210409 RepID=A0A5B7I9V2_PORTR|nr:hypothetical protein [Portunus trituberculatus]